MYIFQTLDLALYAAIIPAAMGAVGAYIIYGRGMLPRLHRRNQPPCQIASPT